MAYAMSALDNLIREELPRVMHESLPEIAPIFKNIQSTSLKVTRDNIGRGWNVIHLYNTGVAGLMNYAEPGGPAIIDIGKQVKMLDYITSGALTPFPTAAEAPHVGSLKRTLTLHKDVGNFSVPATWMQADRLSASQIEQVARDIKAVGDLFGLIEAQAFFSYVADAHSGYTVKVLGRITGTPAETGSTNYVVLTIDEEYGRISNFRVGMAVDVVADSSATIQDGVGYDGTDIRNIADGSATHTIRLVITDVDYLAKTVTVVGIDWDGASVAAYDTTHGWTVDQSNPPASGDWVVVRGCSQNVTGRPLASWGLEDWIKGSGQIMGGAAAAEALDLDTYHQFKSQVVDVSGPLTDTVMNSYIGGYLDSYPGQSLDTLLTTQGVTLKYLEQPSLYNNRMNYDRTGKALDVVGGWSDVKYEFNGRTLRWIVSPMALTKRLYGLKLGGGNIKRYIPPKIGGTDARVGSEVEFLAPLGGHSGIFKIAHASTGASEDILEAPFWRYKLLAPVDVRGVKLTGLTEATMV